MLREILKQRRSQVIELWCERVYSTYSKDAARTMTRNADPFANPAGNAIRKGLELIFDALVEDGSDKRLLEGLDSLVRLRAVQDFTPREAVGELFSIKRIAAEQAEGATQDELSWFDARVDDMMLAAFDTYMGCREQVYEVRYSQLKKMNHVLLARANRMLGLDGPGEDRDGTRGNGS